MNSENWLSVHKAWFHEHKTSWREITDLLQIADRDIKDASDAAISPDWRLAIAYNAAFQCATAALAAKGFRVIHDAAHHYRTLESLEFTLGLERKIIDQLQAFRKKRNVSDYERIGAISEREVQEMLKLARFLRAEVEKWIRENYPGLV